MLYYLYQWEAMWGPLRLFRYVTFRGIMALITALMWGMIVGPKIFAILKRMNIKNVVRNETMLHNLSVLHQQKSCIPTMGGLAIVSGVLLSSALWLKFNVYSCGALLSGLIPAGIGFIDDRLKIKYKNMRGIASQWKWFAQGATTLILLYALLKTPEVGNKIDSLYVPFCKYPLWTTLPAAALFLYWFLVISGTSNAFNLTDGMDGLATGCAVIVLLTYTIFAYITGNVVFSRYLNLPYLKGVEELSVLCFAIVGAGIAFLWFNTYPAEIFMGDTGSLALGTWIGSIALMTQQAFTLVIIGFAFVAETLSVILQVSSFKFFKYRCFKMSPLHHHFELSAIPEPKIVVRFWIISILCALLGLMTLKLR